MNPELPSPMALPALPVRRRETLDIFDTALKLYRRYFWVLLGWSALTSLISVVPFFSFFLLFTMPLLYGAVSCCVAAAVRGQNVKFGQCWSFTKPRYGALLGTIMLSYVILTGVMFALVMAGFLVVFLGAFVLSNAPEPLQITGAIIGSVLGLVAFSVLGVVSFGWTNMVPIVVCLEDDKRSSAALSRAFDLLKGNWRRVFGLCLILGLAMIAAFALVGVIYALVGIGASLGEGSEWGILATYGAFMGLFILVWYPAQSLIIAVLYLDLRVRREALDLEWTAYASAPAANTAPAFSPTYIPPPNPDPRPETPFGSEVSTPATPTSLPASFAAGGAPTPGEESLFTPPSNEAPRG